MKVKQEKGFTGIDVAIAIIAITLFSTLIVTLIYNNFLENTKLKKETLAMIYITEIFENVGIQSYEKLENGNYEDIGNNSYSDNIEKLVPLDITGKYKIDIAISEPFNNIDEKENILKKINVTLTYNINDKKYSCSMERMKIKE